MDKETLPSRVVTHKPPHHLAMGNSFPFLSLPLIKYYPSRVGFEFPVCCCLETPKYSYVHGGVESKWP
jgi:hypothetical protein